MIAVNLHKGWGDEVVATWRHGCRSAKQDLLSLHLRMVACCCNQLLCHYWNGSEIKTVEAATYCTTVAPHVEGCGSTVARAIASGAKNVAKGILWCGVVTVDRLHWANEVSPEMLGHIKMIHVRICDYLLMMNLKTVVKVFMVEEKVDVGLGPIYATCMEFKEEGHFERRNQLMNISLDVYARKEEAYQ
ncbi:hypothetical protein ACQJBY_065916 [Aegilops geniculata]